MLGRYHKRLLPNYGVFDEQRWFVPGDGPRLRFVVAGVPVGITICEDMWFAGGPMAAQAAAGARLLVNLNASPYSRGRREERLAVLADRVAETGCAIVYVNQVGGQDELVFDGASLVMGPDGSVVASAAQFVEEVLLAGRGRRRARDGECAGAPAGCRSVVVATAVSRRPADAAARPGGRRRSTPRPRSTRRWCSAPATTWRKNGFTDAVIGLSGGIDSSLVAAIAVDALGPDHVHGVTMPSRYSSEGSVADAVTLAANLGIDIATAPIEAAHRALADHAATRCPGASRSG